MTTRSCTAQEDCQSGEALSKLVVLGLSPQGVKPHSGIATGHTGDHVSSAVAEWRVGNRQRLALIMHGSNMPNYPILSSPLQCKRLLLRVAIIHGEHPASPLLPSHPLLSIFLPEKNVSLMK